MKKNEKQTKRAPFIEVPWSGDIKSQVKLLIISNAFCLVQLATAQTKKGIFFHVYGVAEAPPDFKPAGLAVCVFSPSWFFSVTYLEFPRTFLYL
jgi:hypothetical protein